MEEDSYPHLLNGQVSCIEFGLASSDEICKYSINNCPISHPSQLGNPFLGLPLESGRCESCGTVETEKCEGHFGYVELPTPIYHPSHTSELRNILSLLCLKCMRIKKGKIKCDTGKEKISVASCFYCREIQAISVHEVKKNDGAIFLELRVSSRNKLREGFWNFLDKFGIHHVDASFQALHPMEVLKILSEIPEETRKRLSARGYVPQTGFIMQYLPVAPNCLSLPVISDGKIIMSSDDSKNLLRKVFTNIEKIKTNHTSSSETSESDINSLQVAVARYLNFRGISKKVPQDMNRNLKMNNEVAENSSKQWLDKMRMLFISKGSGFSSRSVITGDPYIGVDVIGLPSEIAQRVTFEERVSVYNLERLQKMVNNRLCVAYVDGETKFSIETSAEGHVKLKIGQIVCRRVIDGDVVFLNRPPSTHKHSVQAFFVSIHDEHVVKINPLVCSPLGADFDGDCVHLFYPQSLSAKAEALELFSVEKQLLSSHNALLNMQFVQDSLLSLRLISSTCFLTKVSAQQLSMFVPHVLPSPAIVRAPEVGPLWTIFQILQCGFPATLDCTGDRHFISRSEILHIDFRKDSIHSSLVEMVSAVLSSKGPKEGLIFLNTVQPLLMEILNVHGFSINLQDFDIPKTILADVHDKLQEISCLLSKPRSSFREVRDLQVEDHLKFLKLPIIAYILKSSSLGNLIDSKSESSISKVLQQLGCVGLELFERGKLYSRSLVQDIFSYYSRKNFVGGFYVPSEACGLVKSSFFRGLNPCEDLVHSISTREVIVRSSRGLTEPGTLFKNLMAILRDAVLCYDGTIRNVCSNSVIQFDYGVRDCDCPAGEPVGVLAATAISNPAYKAVLDSSLSTISSWELMKEILLCKVNYQNDVNDRRVVLYLNDCFCGKKFCKETAALVVQDCLKKFTLRDCASSFSIEYKKLAVPSDDSEVVSGLVGHIHLDKEKLKTWKRGTEDILQKCQEVLSARQKKKGQSSYLFKGIVLSVSECCQQSDDANLSRIPCLQFYYSDRIAKISDESLDRVIHALANIICPLLLETIVKGDARVDSVSIIWVEPSSTSVRNLRRPLKGELAVEVVIEKSSARRNGDAWRTLLDACLPIMHLIDTMRSIPYGIKQVEDLLGISSSFDQSVQRLSTSIKMVAKGVLKEHLILVANSMTCTGILLGFNNGGFKKILRSLKVQMPFTEGTLFTPIKCFERAGEKCHTDSLTSIVSSCLWGKHVAVGTGSFFKVMWDKQQMLADQDVEKDVYDFLELVQTTATEREIGIDDLMYESDYECCLSPEPGTSFGKDPFVDGTDSLLNSENHVFSEKEEANKCSWEKVAEGVESGSCQGWESSKQPDKIDSKSTSTDSVWSGWDTRTVHQHTHSANKSAKEPDSWHGWESNKQQEVVGSKLSLGWDANMVNQPTKSAKEPAKSDLCDSPNQSKVQQGWGWSNEPTSEPVWSSDKTAKISAVNTDNPKRVNGANIWNENKEKDQAWTTRDRSSTGESETWKNPYKSVRNTDWTSSAATMSTHNNEEASFRRPSISEWSEKRASDHEGSAWASHGWSASSSLQSPVAAWNKKEPTKTGNGDVENSSRANANADVESLETDQCVQTKGTDRAWSSHGWGPTNTAHNSWKKPSEAILNSEGVTNTGKAENDDSARPNAQFFRAQKWGDAKDTDNGNSGWKSRGWGSTDRRKTWKTSPRTVVKSDEQKGRKVTGSSELLTHEEEQILFEVGPIIYMARKILHDASVGEPLSSEHQQFVKEQVFEYHPDKEGKVIGGQIDKIMVDKHETYTDSSCFFIVSTNGTKTDFSYTKCLMNLVNQKFPEHGKSFNSKYFRKRSSAKAEVEADADTQQ